MSGNDSHLEHEHVILRSATHAKDLRRLDAPRALVVLAEEDDNLLAAVGESVDALPRALVERIVCTVTIPRTAISNLMVSEIQRSLIKQDFWQEKRHLHSAALSR